MDRTIFSISELANELGITTRTIRYYEEVGLLQPIQREGVAQRLYGPREKARLILILRGRRLGFSLAEIKEMIDLYDVDRSERVQLERAIEFGGKRLREVDQMIEELQEMKEEIEEYQRQFMLLLEKEGDPPRREEDV